MQKLWALALELDVMLFSLTPISMILVDTLSMVDLVLSVVVFGLKLDGDELYENQA